MADVRSRRSIRRALLTTLLASVALIWIATGVVSYLEAQHELDELLDAHLAQSASLLVAQAGREMEEIDVEHSPRLHPYGRRVAFQFWEGGTTLRLHSDNAPNSRLSPRDEGFSDAVVEGARWRVFSGWDSERRFLVQVAERQDSRSHITVAIAKNLLLPLVVALPALGLLIWLGIDRATRPLRSLSAQAASRAPDNLAPFELSEAPAEVEPLVVNLNRLLRRVRTSIDNERQFTADAAHELRTPLAALRAQAQVARGATGDAERRRALDNVIAGCDRASHLVEQLLTLARLEPETFEAGHAPCDLHAVARDAIADIASDAMGKSVEIELDGEEPASVAGDERLLRILARNLVDNAVRYSPPDTVVRVEVGHDAGTPFMTVIDQGPGVAAAEREKLGRRFHRLPGSEASGTGLGLSIVKRIAQLHRASVAFDEPVGGRGLRVKVSFGT
jgi:two-component system sensor histidine kinase QseC